VQVARLGNPLVNELVIGLVDKNRYSRQHPRLDADPDYGFAKYVLYPTLPEIISTRYIGAVNAILGTTFTDLAPTVPRADLEYTFLTGIPGLNKGPGGFVGDVLRINLNVEPVPFGSQNHYGVVGQILFPESGPIDIAGFPNGRRIGDDVVDIALMVMMGALCAPEFVSAGFDLCPNLTAPIAGIPLRDGAPVYDTFFQNAFPYATTPTPGSYLDGLAGNVVQNPTLCYPPSQHGRCPIVPECPECPANIEVEEGFIFKRHETHHHPRGSTRFRHRNNEFEKGRFEGGRGLEFENGRFQSEFKHRPKGAAELQAELKAELAHLKALSGKK